MFAKKIRSMAKNNIIETKPNNIVTGTIIKGDITADGDFRIDGMLTGSINCKGKIVIGQTGSIDGEIICQNADISGRIKAHLKVEQLLTLKSTAELTGNVITGKLSIEPGAKFTGTCDMDSGITKKPISPAVKENEQPKEKLFK
ncbi:MAG: polymer-forming cytoskeletal protein [Bacteroidetes bacterium]|nr:polymer-forming cytoskeletal protein [Bacteroidota bacterium]